MVFSAFLRFLFILKKLIIQFVNKFVHSVLKVSEYYWSSFNFLYSYTFTSLWYPTQQTQPIITSLLRKGSSALLNTANLSETLVHIFYSLNCVDDWKTSKSLRICGFVEMLDRVQHHFSLPHKFLSSFFLAMITWFHGPGSFRLDCGNIKNL